MTPATAERFIIKFRAIDEHDAKLRKHVDRLIEVARRYPAGSPEHDALDELHEMRRRLDRGTRQIAQARHELKIALNNSDE